MAFTQSRLSLTLFGGVSNYSGDLQDKALTLNESNAAFGLGLKYGLTNHLALRLGFNYGKLSATDLENKADLRFRNLSFQTQLVEGNLLLEYTFLDLTRRRFSPYVFGGLAVYHFNPYAYDSLGNKVFLKPLSTEGEGLPEYPDRKPYKLTQLAIPFGAGVKLRVSENATLGYEIGLRKLFTDYLDDVSRTYVDQATLLQERGAKAVEMAYRAGELKGGDTNYPADGTVRGGSQYKDWYYFQGITLEIGLNAGKKGSAGKGNRGRTDCPPKM